MPVWLPTGNLATTTVLYLYRMAQSNTPNTQQAPSSSAIDKIKRNVVCPVELALRVFGGKWRGSILYQLKDGPLRFNALKYRVQDAVVYYDENEDHFLTSKVLSEHLSVLTEFELVEKWSSFSS